MKKKQVPIYFDAEDLAYLERLAGRSNIPFQELIHEAVHRAYLTEQAKERHKAFDELLNMPPMDWGADWEEMKEEMARERYWEIVHPKGAEDRE